MCPKRHAFTGQSIGNDRSDQSLHGKAVGLQTATASEKKTPNEFSIADTHGVVLGEYADVDYTSDGLGWTSAFVSRQKTVPFQQSFAARPDPLVGFVRGRAAPVELRFPKERMATEMRIGSFVIVPGGMEFEAKVERPVDSLHIYVRRELLTELASDMTRGDPEKIELVPRVSGGDPVLEQIALGISEAAQYPSRSSNTYVDNMARAFAARLLRNHSNAEIILPPVSSTRGLSARQLRRVTEFIRANLAGDLSLPQLARECGLSPSHFARLFKQATGSTAYQFVLQSRIERAQILLSDTSMPIATIAEECGFSSQMHLTEVFRKATGVSPASFRKQRSI